MRVDHLMVTRRGVMRESGYTLIELMVTVAIMALLLAAGFPLTLAWMADVHQRDTANTLAEGLSRAKAMAMRNPAGQTDASAPAALLCMSARRLYVPALLEDGSCTDKGIAWEASIPSRVAIVPASGDAPFRCVAYNHRGIPLSVSFAGAACSTSQLNVTAGTQNALVVSVL